MLSDRVKFWRLKNLIHISEKFERICKEKNLDPTKLRPLTIAVGLPMLEHAANEEEDELQELWANLMVSATTNSESSADEVDYKTWTNALALIPNPPMGGMKAGQIGMREPTREKAWAPLGPM